MKIVRDMVVSAIFDGKWDELLQKAVREHKNFGCKVNC